MNNRKQILKNMKKNKKEKNKVEDENYINRFITYLFIFLLLLIVGYLFIGIFVNKTISFKKNKDKEEKEEVQIDNSTILAGEIFDQKEEEYYVLVYNPSDEQSIIKPWKGLYEGKTDSLKVYVVDSTEKLNGNFIVDKDSNKNASSYEDLKIKEPTLIKIRNNSISEYTEGEDAIKNIFKK